MTSVNKVILVGNLGSDPERRAFSNGSSIVTLSVATSEKRKARGSTEYQEFTEWHKVRLTDELARMAMRELHTGDGVYIEGILRHSKYTDRSTDTDRYVTYVQAKAIQKLAGTPRQHHHDSHADDGYGDYTQY